jgi:hypothetical protein
MITNNQSTTKSMTERHPITPPPHKIHNWLQLEKTGYNIEQIIALAAQWGADQELEECCLWLNGGSKIDYDTAALLRAARRPKPLSLKEQALNYLTGSYNANQIDDAMFENIRRALEQLDD